MTRLSPTVLTAPFLALLLLSIPAAAESKEPIRNETLRQVALHSIFPGMEIKVLPGKHLDNASLPKGEESDRRFLDALAREPVYEITGKATNEIEQCAAEDMQTSKFSEVRHLRFQLFEWPNQPRSAMLAVLQYDFAGAIPAGSCWSVGMLVRLVGSASEWKPETRFLLSDHHHSSIQGIQLVDLTGDNIKELIVESDFGGAATIGICHRIFDLRQGIFDLRIATNSYLEHEILDRFTQALDFERTLRSRGERSCFRKVTALEAGTRFEPERVTNLCYPVGEGVTAEAAATLSRWLAPIN